MGKGFQPPHNELKLLVFWQKPYFYHPSLNKRLNPLTSQAKIARYMNKMRIRSSEVVKLRQCVHGPHLG